MRRLLPLALALLTLLAAPSSALARGRGVQSYLVTADGKVAATIGETGGDLLDPVAGVRFRYHEGRVIAAALHKHDSVHWTAAAKPQLVGRTLVWRLLPELIVIVGEDTITGLDRATGKAVYTTDGDGFTRNLHLLKFAGLSDTPLAEPAARPTLFLIDDRSQLDKELNGNDAPASPARLARFDLTSGQFLWKATIITRGGQKLRPRTLDTRGEILGKQEDEDFYFDAVTGKTLDKAPPPEPDPPRKTAAAPRPRVQATADKLEYLDAAGKTLWSRALPGEKGAALVTADTVVIPCVTGRSDTEVIAYNTKDGSEQWRCKLPRAFFADSVTVEILPAKTGYLVQVSWIVLD